jgi:cell division septation protein DedD
MKDKQIPEEELLGELDSMYQRVADIEKEEEAKTLIPEKKNPKQTKKRSYRSIILGAIAILFALILGITFWKPMAILQLLKMGDTQPTTVVTPPPTPKRPAAVPSPAAPKSPAVATSPTTSPPPSAVTPPAFPTPPTVATSPAPPKPPSQSVPVQTKQEAVKTAQEEVKKEKSISQEITKPSKPLPQGKYFAVQVGSFRDIENVRELAEAFKKEGLEVYWITMKSRSRGTLYRVLVGQFMDENEAAQFLKDKKIFKNYPDSFIKEVSSSKINR